MTTVPTGDRGQKKKRIVTLALMAIFLMSASFFLIDRKEETIIVVSFPNGRELEAEVADTPEKLLVGLAFREALPANGGLLYIFESTGQNHLWTKAYRFPVDMIWVDESHHIVGLKENVAPCQLKTIARSIVPLPKRSAMRFKQKQVSSSGKGSP